MIDEQIDDYFETICKFIKALPAPDPPRILYIDKDVPRWKHWFIKRKVKRRIKRELI